VVLDIPEDFLIPTCTQCGEELLIPEVTDELDQLLRAAYLAKQATHVRTCVEVLRKRHGVTQQDIERACGITPSYLSHMMSGRRETSLPLMRLIEVYTLFRESFEYALEGVPFDRYMVGRKLSR